MSDTSSLHIDPAELETTTPVADSTAATVTDPRHQKRVNLMQTLFAYSFDFSHPTFKDQFDQHPELEEILALLPEIDADIQAAAPERPLSDINKVDLAILRLIMFESKRKKTPKKVLINEAVELAKEFGTDSSPRFVNGALAQLLMQEPLSIV